MAFLGNELRRAVQAGTDKLLLDGLALGETPLAGSASVSADIAALLGAITIGDASRLYLATTPELATAAASVTGAEGFVFGSMSPQGGTLAGVPALASDQLPDGRVMLIDASQVAANSDAIVLDSASHASVELSDTPTAGGPATVSLWQNNLYGLRAERYIGFLAPPSAVAVLDGAIWTTP